MKKRGTSRLSVLLAICLIVTAIPMSSAADNTRAATDTSLAGAYILYNSYAQTYATPASTTLTQGTAVQHSSYTGQSTQQWVITQVAGTDLYQIKMGSYCIGCSPDVYLQIPYGTYATNQYWYLEPTEIIDGRFGRYKIRSASPSYSDKVLGVNGLASGTQLELRTYTNDGYYQDEWYLCPVDEASVEFIVNMDRSYSSRFSNWYSRLTAHMSALRQKYLTNYGIWVNYAYPYQVTTFADECDCAYDELCTEGVCNDSVFFYNEEDDVAYVGAQLRHHTNASNILARYENPNRDTTIKMLLLARYTCASKHCRDGEPWAIEGIVNSGISQIRHGVSLVTNWHDMSKERSTVVHEFNHFFGVKDHYTTPAKDTADTYTTEELNQMYPTYGYSDDCIHGKNYDRLSVYSTQKICDGCAQWILANRTTYSEG